MAHNLIGLKQREADYHAHLLSHDHDHGASGHFHEHAQGDAQQAARSATIWLFVTLLGGVFLVTSYIVQLFSPYEDGRYLYDYHIDLAATIGAVLLAVRVIWHALRNLISGHMHMDELVALAIAAALATGDFRAAGIIAFGTIENTSLDDWKKMFDINVVSVFHLMQLSLTHILPRKGNIVNVSSVNGLRSFPGVLAYCSSKSALDQLTRCAALELAAKQVRVNSVNPGVVVTELHRQGGLDEQAYAAFLERSKTTHPIGRVGQPEDLAALIAFLASEEAGWITGATVSIDGGRHLTCAR